MSWNNANGPHNASSGHARMRNARAPWEKLVGVKGPARHPAGDRTAGRDSVTVQQPLRAP